MTAEINEADSKGTHIGPKTQEELMERTANRKVAIVHNYKRVAKKLADNPDSPGAPTLKQRRDEYQASLECIAFTEKTGIYVKAQSHNVNRSPADAEEGAK